MLPAKEKLTIELQKAKSIWKDLVNYHQPDGPLVSEIFSRYKIFLEENEILTRKENGPLNEIEIIEKKLNQYFEATASREKRILLNDACVGLILGLSESIDELKSMMEEDAFSTPEQVDIS